MPRPGRLNNVPFRYAFVALACVSGLAALPSSAATTTRPATAPSGAAELTSPPWWVKRAAAEVAAVPDEVERASMYATVADLQVRAGDRAGFTESARRFREWAASAAAPKDNPKSVIPRMKAYGYAALAKAYGRAGDVAAMRACIVDAAKANPADPHNNDYMLINGLSEVGQFEAALAIGTGTHHIGNRVFMLGPIAEAQAKASRRDEARRTLALAEADARKVLAERKDEERLVDPLDELAGRYVAAGELDAAVKIITELPLKERVEHWVSLSAAHLAAGNRAEYSRFTRRALDELNELKRKDPDGIDMPPAAARLAALQADAGERGLAQKTLDLVNFDPKKAITAAADFHYRAALTCAKSGDVAGARAGVELARAAEAKEADAGFDVLETLRSFTYAWYSRIARALLDAGHPEEVADMLKRLDAVDSPQAGAVRVILANAYAASGNVEEARRHLGMIDDVFARDVATWSSFAAAGRAADPKALPAVRDWAASLERPNQRANAYFMVAQGVLERAPRQSPAD